MARPAVPDRVGRGDRGVSLRTILLFVLFCLALSVVILIHTSNNNFASVLWVGVSTTLDFARYALAGGVVGFAALAVVLLAATRGRLGYRQEPHADPV